MEWKDIKRKYPDQFILIGNVVEKKIDRNKVKILSGNVLKTSFDGKEIRSAYREYREKGIEVLYSIPSTPEEFVMRLIPLKGILPCISNGKTVSYLFH